VIALKAFSASLLSIEILRIAQFRLNKKVEQCVLSGDPHQILDWKVILMVNSASTNYQITKKWVLLLFYPLDFTFVCPTEVLNFSAAAERFNKLNCQIFGISVDSIYVHKSWVDTKQENGGHAGAEGFPVCHLP